MNYSICLLDEGGRTLRSEFGPYHDDVAALAEARMEVAGSPIVEVWRENLLVARLFREPNPAAAVQ